MKRILFIFTILTTLNIFGQYETSHWFFGTHAGLNFQSGTAVPETGGQMDTEEGCSSLSDVCGNLLMYTNGVVIYNANHQIMPNGNGLHGSPSSTQSGIIVPKPNNDLIKYVFTVDEAYSGFSASRGLKYTIVDMNLDGGLGDVPQDPNPNPSGITYKNIPLIDHASEKVTAVSHADGESTWVLTLAPPPTNNQIPYTTSGINANTVYAFKVTSTGIENTAIISNLNIHVEGGIGYMKASPDGNKIAIANMLDGSAYLLDFNSATGQVSNPVSLFNFQASPYGLEFSPDSSKLYIGDRENRLYQIDLINNNEVTTISRDPNYRSALQLGLDGKIYQTYTIGYGQGSNQMSVIENPNEAGTACNYHYRSITLPSGMIARQGLPPFNQSYFSQIGGLQNLAVEITQNLEINSKYSFSSIDWDFGDGTTAVTYPDNPPDNTHSSIQHTFTEPGNYTVTAIIHLDRGCVVNASMEVTIYPLPTLDGFDNTLEFCDINQNGKVTITLHDMDQDIINQQTVPGNYIVKYYPTQQDAENQTNELTDPYTNVTPYNQEIFIRLDNINTLGNIIGPLQIIVHELPEIHPIPDYEICDTDTDGFASFELTSKIDEILNGRDINSYNIAFYHTQSDAETSTNPISDPYINSTAFNETVWYRIESVDTGCKNYGEFELVVHPYQNIDMEDEYILCRGHQLEITAPNGFQSYEWSNGMSGQTITIDQPGNLSLTLIDNNSCAYNHNLIIKESDLPDEFNIEIHDFQENNYIIINTEGIGNYEYSIDNINFQEENIIEHLAPGTYTVFIKDKNGCGTVSRTIDIIDAPNFFTPNGDGYNDYWQAINLRNKPGSYINIFDRYGKLLKVLLPTEQGWDGSFEGRPMPATDYWYVAFIKEGNDFRKVKGHFSLKR
jgi:gliding motility-associated-like protein